MIKHTPEPWAAYLDASGDVFISSAETSFHIAEVGSEDDETVIPDARRIVACVNACAGVDTALLEAGELDKPTMLVIQENKDLKHRCDELLAALDEISKLPSYRQDECSEMARDAIAKANGGAS